MDVDPGATGLAAKLTKALRKLYLEVIVEGVLSAEENDTALGDCSYGK